MARTSSGCVVQGCDGGHVAAGLCHFGDGPHRCKGLCGFHYDRSRRELPLEGPPVKAKRSPLTADDVRQIRHLRDVEEQRPSVIAKRYGVSKGAITNICARRTWADVD